MRIAALILTLFLAPGCADDGSDPGSSAICSIGSLFSSGGFDHCVIQETGFLTVDDVTCPPAQPHKHDLEGVIVCSPQETLSPETIAGLEQEKTDDPPVCQVCTAVEDANADDAWCQSNCTHVPPFCPADFCACSEQPCPDPPG